MAEQSEAEVGYPMTVRKWDVIDSLRREHGLQSAVLIVTPTAGSDMEGRPETDLFATATTLTYAADPHRREIEGADAFPTLATVGEWCTKHQPEADLVFIDCWHTYEDSLCTLELALAMLPRGGFIVIHDCDPPNLEIAGSPKASCLEAWCGETWRAFIDVTASLPARTEWFVVESDYGIGVIKVAPSRARWRRLRGRRIAARKRLSPAGDQAGWDWFMEHRAETLHPLPIAEWQLRASAVSAVSHH